MIDVQDSSLNLILNICFFLILGLGLVSIVPWKLRAGKNRWTLVLPILAIVLYLVYELTMPNNWDIRLDLIILWPILALIILLTVVRVLLIWRYSARSRQSSS